MRTLKKLAALACVALLSGTSLWGQPDMSRNKVISGSNGKMIVFYGLENWQNVYLSRNGRFVFGQSENSGFIYELSSGQFRYFEDSYVVEVKDWDNYVTSSYAKIDDDIFTEYTQWNTGPESLNGNAFTVVAASEDLQTLMAKAYMSEPGSPSLTFILDTKTGDILKTLELFDISPDEVGVVSTGLAMSNDGKIIVGRASMPEANSNFSAALWDRNLDRINYVGTKIVNPGDIASDGELEAVSADGTFAAGDNNNNAYIVRYNRTTGSFTTEYIPRWASSDASFAWGVSDNHAVIGAEQSGDAGTRVPYIYFADKEIKYNLNDYCRYLYGLDVEKEVSLFSPNSLSSDARIFTGFTYASGVFYPYVVVLDATQAYAPALDVQAAQSLGTANVQVRWSAPLKGDYELQGYNVYRGQTKVNTALVAADKNTFLDTDVPVGKHRYSVEAVYAEGVAPKSDSVSVYVIDPDGCLPVQSIHTNVIYNRTVQLEWDLPSSETPHRKGVIQTEDAYPAGFFQPGLYTLSAAVKVGDYIYTTTIGGEFTIYDASTHKALKSIEIQGLTSAYDMTYHDGIFWVASNSDQILELALDNKDPLDVSLSRYWSARIMNVTHIAYVENEDQSFNEGEDYLVLGGYENVLFYPVTATAPEQSLPGSGTGFDNLTIGGSEYHNGKLYITDQGGVNGCDLVTFDMATKKEIHRQNLFENAQIVGYAGGSVSYPLGLTKTTLSDGTVVLECLMQSNIGANFVVDLEIETAPSVLGYRVYRNDEPVSDTLRFRHFEEDIFEEGTYIYTIEYLDQKGCSINSSVVDVTSEVVITPIGKCGSPADLKGYESNRIAILTWDDKELGAGLVGFNVYRNGSLISEPRLLDLKFYDTAAKMNEKYMYVVEAFYNNSCVASDTVEITLSGKGTAEAPAAVTVKGMLHDTEDGKFDAKASWELPFFETPMPYGYCKHPAYAYSISDTSKKVYCAIGWDADDMAKFSEDLYLVGVEFMLGTTQVEDIRTLVYVDDVLVHVQPFDDRFSEWEWIRAYFTKVYPMKQEHEIGVGYAVAYNPEEVSGVFVYDLGPGKPQYSDLISGNGEQFDNLARLGIDANLCINALVVRQRDIEAAASAPDPQAYIEKKVMTMDAVLSLSGHVAEAPAHARKATSDGIKLLGFNVYRDDEKVNETLLTGLEYTDANLSLNKEEYEYRVSAVYDGADEKFSDYQYVYTATLDNETEAKVAGVSVYPNPSAGAFNLQMAQAGAVEIYDMTGRVVLRREAAAGVNGLSLDRSGVYMVRVLTNGKTVTIKLVVR